MANVVKLTPEQLNALDNGRRVLNDLLPDLDALQKCGEPCADLLAKRNALAQGYENIVKYFGAQQQ
jgi:hypothetical protein